MTTCAFCDIVFNARSGIYDGHFIAETPSSILLLDRYQVWRGYCLLISKTHAHEIFQLHDPTSYLSDMVQVSHVLWQVFDAGRMNCAQLGNEMEHLHYHLIPRHGAKDPGDAKRPIWEAPRSVRKPEKIADQKLKDDLRRVIRNGLVLYADPITQWSSPK